MDTDILWVPKLRRDALYRALQTAQEGDDPFLEEGSTYKEAHAWRDCECKCCREVQKRERH